MTRDPGAPAPPVVSVRGLTFAYQGYEPVLRDLDLDVAAGTRAILVGANGAGKSTLLRVIGGKHLVPEAAVRVLGRPAFHDTSLAASVALLGGTFPFNADVRVGQLVDGVRGVDPARRAELLAILDVDLDWHMHRVSDGQRRRVQILLGLLRPSALLLLDEITTDLDVIARQDLLALLRAESEQRGATILYATHIFDGLEEWTTHVVHLRRGRLVQMAPLDALPELRAQQAAGATSPLLRVVVGWLRAERDGRRAATAD
jgi:CCR4-NOT complex subunit CAF16